MGIVGIYIKNVALNFSLCKAVFWKKIYFSINKMVDNMDIHKSVNINIKRVMKNPEMLKFVPD